MLVIVYFLFYAFYLYRANRNLRTRAYSETRTARTLWYFQVGGKPRLECCAPLLDPCGVRA